jgi:hypothetical protein
MTALDTASLVFYPSGYKESKLYSIKPTDGTGDLTFTRASSATRVNAQGLIESVATNVPRIDFTGGGCGSLLLEPQRTNLLTYSEDFSNAIWTNTGGAISVDPTADFSPNNTLSGNEFNEGTSSGRRAVFEDISVTANQSYTLTVFVKKETLDYFRIAIGYSGTDWTAVEVDLSDNSLTIGDGDNNTFTSISSSISSNDYNGYYKLALTATHPIATSLRLLFCTADGAAISSTNSYGRPDYVGTGKTVFVWGCGFELGSYPTSYIPTSGTTVTRIADASSTTGLSSVINSTEGVLYAEIAALADDGTNRVITLNDGSTSNRVQLYFNTSNQIVGGISAGGSGQANITHTINIKSFLKVAFKYKANDFALWVNGVKVGEDLIGNAPTGLNTISFDNTGGTLPFYGKVQNLIIFPTALTDEQLTDLTGTVHTTFNSLALSLGYTIL